MTRKRNIFPTSQKKPKPADQTQSDSFRGRIASNSEAGSEAVLFYLMLFHRRRSEDLLWFCSQVLTLVMSGVTPSKALIFCCNGTNHIVSCYQGITLAVTLISRVELCSVVPWVTKCGTHTHKLAISVGGMNNQRIIMIHLNWKLVPTGELGKEAFFAHFETVIMPIIMLCRCQLGRKVD